MARKMTRMGRRTREKLGPHIPALYIRELRKEQSLSMVELLDKVAAHGVVLTEASLSRIERSLQPADTPTLHGIAKALGVTMTTLLTGIRPKADGIEHLYERLPARERAVARRLIQGMAEDAETADAPSPPGPKAAKRRPKG